MKRSITEFIFLYFFLLIILSSACNAQTETNTNPWLEPPRVVEVPKIKSSETSDKDSEIYKINPTPDENNSSKVYIPKNLEDSFVELNRMLHPKFIEKFKNGGKDEIAKQHFGLGLWMRNNWGLWANSRLAEFFMERGLNHPDDMSSIILSNFQLRLNGKPLEVEKQIAYFKEYARLAADPPKKTFPGCKAGVESESLGYLIDETPEKMPRVIHYGYCKSNEKLWVFEHGKGWYIPDSNLIKRIEEPEFPLPNLPETEENSKSKNPKNN